MIKMYKLLELFSGTESVSKTFKENGWEVFTIDNEPKFNPNLCKDILEVKKEEDGTFIPKNEEVLHSIELVKKALEIIFNWYPRAIYFIENPRAMLRKQDFMENLPRKTITYCQYGTPYQKATDIWTNCTTWQPKPPCSAKSPCHVRAPRGSSYGIQGMKFKQFPKRNGQKPLHPIDIASHDRFRENREQKHPQDSSRLRTYGKNCPSLHPHDLWATMEFNWDFSVKIRRGIVPKQLCEEICIACEKELS